LGQGYYFGRPMPHKDVVQFVNSLRKLENARVLGAKNC